MASSFTVGNVNDLAGNPAFKALMEKLQNRLAHVEETFLLDASPFTHGRGVGEREVIKFVFSLANQDLLSEAHGDSPVKKLR